MSISTIIILMCIVTRFQIINTRYIYRNSTFCPVCNYVSRSFIAWTVLMHSLRYASPCMY
jgi:hypothetical protein